MTSTFFGIETARRALATSQLALNVVNQNTSNVNTPGYSRQKIEFSATDPYTPPDFDHTKPGEIGTGVAVASIQRVRDDFVDKRIYAANSDQGALDNLRDMLGRVESAYGEPSANGVGSLLTGFFNSFSDLSANPESGAIRSTVLNKAEALVSSLHSVNTALSQIGPEIQSKILVKVNDVNNIAGQIADLNKQIRLSLAAGDHPNDLEDKRGALLDKLSTLVDIQIVDGKDISTGRANGDVQINVGGYQLVQGDTATKLPSILANVGGEPGLITPNGDPIAIRGGEIYGLAKATELLKGYQSDLDRLASNIIQSVNTQHEAGYGLDGSTARPFFSGANAASIEVSDTIKTNLNAIAAAAAPTLGGLPAPGNGDNARALAAFTAKPVISGFSLNGYYNARVAGIGADSQTYQSQADNQQKVVAQLKNQQASVSGVSLDEELTNMMQYQRTYQAAARMINVMDDALDRIINGLGAGR